MSDSTGSQSERQARQPVGVPGFFLVCVLIFAFGLGSSYLIWGDPNRHAPRVVNSGPTRSAMPERVVGNRENPVPLGTEVTIGDWTLVLNPPQSGAHLIADEYTGGEYALKDPLPQGLDLVLVPATATYQGKETGVAWIELKLTFIGDDSQKYPSDTCFSDPDRIGLVYQLYNGGVAAGNYCVEMPSDASGLWAISTTGENADQVFFNAK